MSNLTFNIADYRPLSHERAYASGPSLKARSGFVVLSSNSEPREYEPTWLDARPAVVEIRSVRETHRICPRRAKVLRFRNPASHRLYTMPAQDDCTQSDDDPGPLVA